MPSHYHQLCAEERAGIVQMTAQGYSLRCIARLLRRAPSSISREVRRNATPPTATLPQLPGAELGGSPTCHGVHASYSLTAPPSSSWLNCYAKAGTRNKSKADCKYAIPTIQSCTCPTKPSTPPFYAMPRGELRKELIRCLR